MTDERRTRPCVCGHLTRRHGGIDHHGRCRVGTVPTYSWTDEAGATWQYLVFECECQAYERRGPR